MSDIDPEDAERIAELQYLETIYGQQAEEGAEQHAESHNPLSALTNVASSAAHSIGSHLHLPHHTTDRGYEEHIQDEEGNHKSHFSLNPLNAIDSAWARGKNLAHSMHHHHHDSAHPEDGHHSHNPLSAIKHAASSAAHAASSAAHGAAHAANAAAHGDLSGIKHAASSAAHAASSAAHGAAHAASSAAHGIGSHLHMPHMSGKKDKKGDKKPNVEESAENVASSDLPEVVDDRGYQPAILPTVSYVEAPADFSILTTDEVCHQQIPELYLAPRMTKADTSWWKCCTTAPQNGRPKKFAYAGGATFQEEPGCTTIYCSEMGKELFSNGH